MSSKKVMMDNNEALEVLQLKSDVEVIPIITVSV